MEKGVYILSDYSKSYMQVFMYQYDVRFHIMNTWYIFVCT